MAPRKTAVKDPPAKRAAPRAKRPPTLPDQLDRPEVLLACFYRATVSAHSDRPDAVEAMLREAVGTPVDASHRRALAKPLRGNIGVVRWSEAQQCLWFKQGRAAPYRVDPSRITAEQRALVATEEPRGRVRTGHSAGQPLPDPAAP